MAEYVLPKFEVKIESRDHYTCEDEHVQVVIRAKYTHGNPLKGTAVVSINDSISFVTFNSGTQNPKIPLAKKTVIVDGWEMVEFHIKNELRLNRDNFGDSSFKITVDFTETLTGLSQSTEKTIKIYKDAYEISTDLRDKSLKRGSTVNAIVCYILTQTKLFFFFN